MPPIHIQANVTPGQLLEAVEQMTPEDQDRFVDEVLALRAGRRVRRLSTRESELLETVNKGLTAAERRRYDTLVTRREDEDLTGEENAELLRLTDELESLNVERMKALSSLAGLRQVPLRTMMQELGIKPHPHA